MWFSRPKPNKMGQKNLRIKDGTYESSNAFRGALKPKISGGFFTGETPLYGAKNPQVTGGEFHSNLCFFSAENAEISGGLHLGKMAYYGTQNPNVQGGQFKGDWAFMESTGALVVGGVFSGLGAFSEARKAHLKNGTFTCAEVGITSSDMVISGGVYSGKQLLKTSDHAIVVGGEITGEGAFEEAQELRVLHTGVINHVYMPLSGIIAARRLEKVSFPNGKPEDLLIYAEEVGEGAGFVQILKADTIPRQNLSPGKAIDFLQGLADL
jgi:hypothetical protein